MDQTCARHFRIEHFLPYSSDADALARRTQISFCVLCRLILFPLLRLSTNRNKSNTTFFFLLLHSCPSSIKNFPSKKIVPFWMFIWWNQGLLNKFKSTLYLYSIYISVFLLALSLSFFHLSSPIFIRSKSQHSDGNKIKRKRCKSDWRWGNRRTKDGTKYASNKLQFKIVLRLLDFISFDIRITSRFFCSLHFNLLVSIHRRRCSVAI